MMNGIKTVFCILWLFGAAAMAEETKPNAGYYQGLDILYPYKPVYCDKDSGIGSQCYGSPGDLVHLPASAPLPETHNVCDWADPASNLVERWYRWEPREVPTDQRKYLGARVCYFEDRGSPKNLNDLPR